MAHAESLIRITSIQVETLSLKTASRSPNEPETPRQENGSRANLDETDIGILRHLQENARASFKRIGEDVGVSEATVFVRVKKLQERGIIRGFKAIVDPKGVGKTVTAITLVRAMPRNFLGILDELEKMDEIYEIYDVTGQYSSILKIRAGSTDELSKVIDRIGMVEGVAGTETIIVLRTVKEDTSVKI
ncbi:MAG TPA: Lrp/AsnC family transcriptional regulator [Candidatus Binatus sp.]|nr:Lrp/AsnC family transcriptional regulator [Candidatus Binatus sp.]